jgi:hypothetical protein
VRLDAPPQMVLGNLIRAFLLLITNASAAAPAANDGDFLNTHV